MDNLNFFEKVAVEQARTQIKLRDEFIRGFIKESLGKDEVSKEAIDTLKSCLIIAYNRGAADALAIMATARYGMEEGEYHDI